MAPITRDLADAGWLVEVILVTPSNQPGSRFFAVGTQGAIEAEEAALRYPGLVSADRRIARRRLSPTELLDLGLKAQADRPYRYPGCSRNRNISSKDATRRTEETPPNYRLRSTTS